MRWAGYDQPVPRVIPATDLSLPNADDGPDRVRNGAQVATVHAWDARLEWYGTYDKFRFRRHVHYAVARLAVFFQLAT